MPSPGDRLTSGESRELGLRSTPHIRVKCAGEDDYGKQYGCGEERWTTSKLGVSARYMCRPCAIDKRKHGFKL